MRFYHRTTNTAKAECPGSPVWRHQCRSYSSKRTKQQEAGSREPDPEQEILTTPTGGFPPPQQQWTAILQGSSKRITYQTDTTFSVSWRQREGRPGVWTQPQCRAPDIRGARTAHGTGEMHLYSRFLNDMITVKNQANKNQNNQYMNPELPNSSSMRDADADHHYPGKCGFPYSYISTGLPNRFIK